MNRIESASERLAWFDLEKYDLFKSLDERQIVQQLRIRRHLKGLAEILPKNQLSYLCDDIQQGQVYLSDTIKGLVEQLVGQESQQKINENSEWESELIHSVLFRIFQIEDKARTVEELGLPTLIDLRFFLDKYLKNNGVESIERLDNVDRFLDLDKSINECLYEERLASNCVEDWDIYLQIKLDDRDDEEILSTIREKLPYWREKYKAAETKKVKVREGELKKLITYRIFPLLDLVLWAKCHDLFISNTVLAGVLFPDYSRGEKWIAETALPFCEKVMGDNYGLFKQTFHD